MASSRDHGRRVPLKEAVARGRANEFGRVLGRDSDNRIEPECWPVVRPGFQFSKDQKFFTIGSCFAGNIGRRLVTDGYNVHNAGEQRTRYTPAAIFQEIDWAGRILHRDGTVRPEDVEPILIETAPGRFADLWNRPGNDEPADLEAAVERRRALYNYFSGAFEADVVVLTLGLIEAWHDSVSNSYVEFDSGWLRRRDRDRFSFEVLTFARCKDFVRRTLELLLDGKRRVLMTTSPVVLARTFTDDDIIIANNHSKSVLRAVAGEITAEMDGVDYFPSYEIATIGPRAQVWEDDLRHVKPNFVARIMQHVSNAYLPGAVTDIKAELMHMATLIDAGEFERAAGLHARLAEAADASDDPAIHFAVVRLALNRGDAATAVRHALRFDPDASKLYFAHPEWMLEAARARCASDEHRATGEAMLERLRSLCPTRLGVLKAFLTNRERARDEDGVRFVLELVETADAVDPGLTHRASQRLQHMGETDRALALLERHLEKMPDSILVLERYARLLQRDRRAGEAVAPLRRIAELEPDADWAHFALARTLASQGEADGALQAIDSFLAVKPRDAEGLALKARLLARLGRRTEAGESAQAAATAADGDPRILQKIQLFLPA